MRFLTTRLLYTISIIGLLLGQMSCKKWLNINQTPNQIAGSNMTPDFVLPGILLRTAYFSNRDGVIYFHSLNNWMGYWCPPDGALQDDEEQSYNITNNFTPSGLFAAKYDENNNYNFIEKKAAETGQTFYEGIAKAMKAMNFAILVDIYGNIPYEQSGDPDKYFQPTYTNGETVYIECMKNLDESATLIKNTDINKNKNISTADIMFNGNRVGWLKFINTLKLRLLIHQANKNDKESYIKSEIAKILIEGSGFLGEALTISNGTITRTTGDASVNPGYEQQNYKINGFYSQYGFTFSGETNYTADSYRANIIAMNYLKSDQDPRLGLFYLPVISSVPGGASEPFVQPAPYNFRGNEYGLSINPGVYPYQTRDFVSRVGGVSVGGPVTPTSNGILKGFNMDMWIITSIESKFLQAEAIQRGWLPGEAKTAYLDAVKESFRWLNAGGNSNNISLSDAVFLNWYNGQDDNNNGNVSWDDANDKYKLLMYQKYLAFDGINPMETWTDYRRNGAFPNIPLSVHPARTSNSIPVRWFYPASEYTYNSANVQKQGNINQFTSKIWWMP